ncbi:MAG: HAD family hydrolase [Bacteroidetes bacterium]|nr:HAD family hydrolase [Bacteroidota bacterium]
MSLKDLKIDNSWSLFLDRDGVINNRLVDDYVRNWEQFEFKPGVEEAMKVLSGIFGRIIVVSNQQGVGKGLMTLNTVEKLHEKMVSEVEAGGGRIDAVYFCPALESEKSFNRKPNIGMALQSRKRFPDIRFRQSVMVGDSLSDMIFGKRVGMKTVFLSSNLPHIRRGYKTINFVFPDLRAFAKELMSDDRCQINRIS